MNSIKLSDIDFYDSYHIVQLLLFRFFQLMGSVFGFVSSDVKAKIEILKMHRQKENAEQFETFATMMEYEKTSALLDKQSNFIAFTSWARYCLLLSL